MNRDSENKLTKLEAELAAKTKLDLRDESTQSDFEIDFQIFDVMEETKSKIVQLEREIEQKSGEILKLQELLDESSSNVQVNQQQIEKLTSKLDEIEDQNVKLIESTAEYVSNKIVTKIFRL